MATFRLNKTKAFTQIDNGTFNDPMLSFEARGALAYLLTKNDYWNTCQQDIMREGKIGRYKATRIFRELEEAGYLQRNVIRLPNGRYTTKNNLFDHKSRNPFWNSPPNSETLSMYFENDQADNPHSAYDSFSDEERISMRQKMLEFCLSNQIPAPNSEEQWSIIEHPNVIAWMVVTNKWRGWTSAEYIRDAMGDRPASKAALKHANTLWIASGYRPDNLIGIIEWYHEILNGNDSPHDKRKRSSNNGNDRSNSQASSQAGGESTEPTADDVEWFKSLDTTGGDFTEPT